MFQMLVPLADKKHDAVSNDEIHGVNMVTNNVLNMVIGYVKHKSDYAEIKTFKLMWCRYSHIS
jgi:hypothetical protein